MLSNSEIIEIRNYVCDCIQEAGKIAMSYFGKRSLMIKLKGVSDIVTEADFAVDRFLISSLKKKYPSIAFLTEESVKGDLQKYRKEKMLWIIDPIDGTHNFSRGERYFAISIALYEKGSPTLGVCFLPVFNELYFADTTSTGVYLDGKKLRFVQRIGNDTMHYVISMNLNFATADDTQTNRVFRALIPHAQFIKIGGSSVCDILSLITGKIDAYIDTSFKPWDMAAAAYIVEKAGAKVTNLEGSRLNVFTPRILAAPEEVHTKLLQILQKSS